MKVRLIDHSEAEACNNFYNELYGKSRTIDQWKWEFTDNPHKPKIIPFVVVDDDKVVGTQACIPTKMVDAEGVYLTAKSEETLLDPAYRGKQLFGKMYEQLFKYCEDHGFQSIWGFTPATKAFTRLGFNAAYMTSQVIFPLSHRALPTLLSHEDAKEAKGLKYYIYWIGGLIAAILANIKHWSYIAAVKSQSSVDVRILDSAPIDAAEVTNRFIKRYGGKTIYRDQEYIQWRLFNNPYVEVKFAALYEKDKLTGWIAFTLADDGLMTIVDVFHAPYEGSVLSAKNAVVILHSYIINLARKAGIAAIRGWHVNSHPFALCVLDSIKSLGFYHVKKGHSTVIYITDAGKSRQTDLSFNDWYITRLYTEGPTG